MTNSGILIGFLSQFDMLKCLKWHMANLASDVARTLTWLGKLQALISNRYAESRHLLEDGVQYPQSQPQSPAASQPQHVLWSHVR